MSDGIDFEAGAPAARACVSCGQPIRDEYWEANGKVACTACKDRIDSHLPSGSVVSRFLMASALGTGAMILGAAVWWAVARFAHIHAAIIAIGIGWLVGMAVQFGSQHRGGWVYQLLAVALTYLSIVFAYSFLILGELDAGQRADLGVLAWPVSFVMSFVAPVLGGASSILTVLIIGFGLWTAWKINRKVAIFWSGPHRVLQPGERPPAPAPLPGFPGATSLPAPPPLPEREPGA
jgi:hypothetical protein